MISVADDDALQHELLPVLPPPGTAVELDAAGGRGAVHALHGTVERTRGAGLLVRTRSGWRTFFSLADLFANHIRLVRPPVARAAVAAARARLLVAKEQVAQPNPAAPWAATGPAAARPA